MLSVPQQARAALAYVRQELRKGDVASLLQDEAFSGRLDANFITLYGLFTELYGYRADCLDNIVALIRLAGQSWQDRSDILRKSDKDREIDQLWFQSNKMIGGVLYVDRYAATLKGVQEKIPYFKELGLTYVHLMPVFTRPERYSDGGYAVSSYRDVDPKLGTIDDLRELSIALREAGISLVIDAVFNHTSSEHEWARKARAGDPEYEAYYWIFRDSVIPNEFAKTVREIFPDDHRRSFIMLEDGRHVWSTFYHTQWDLNYSNPAVFRAMAGELLFLANLGVDFIRMDAVAFMWKRMGTTCESQPECHLLLRAFNALCRIAAPGMLFKSEAIVHPDEVVSYIDHYECQISYNPLQMALGWEALATRDASMLSQALERRHNISNRCAWVNYCRSHDDIGWTFADEDALELGKQGFNHRRFLNAFFVNRHPGSFARGVPFQDNPRTGDCRISGTTASLAGLESGEYGALERVLLIHSVAFSTGGIPLIYLGDEVGQLNNYGYMNNPDEHDDSRWVHRPYYPKHLYAQKDDLSTIPGRLFAGFKHLIKLRKETEELSGGRLIGFHTHNHRVLGYQRQGAKSTILCLCNFDDNPQWVGKEVFSFVPKHVYDIANEREVDLSPGIHLQAHGFVWLKY